MVDRETGDTGRIVSPERYVEALTLGPVNGALLGSRVLAEVTILEAQGRCPETTEAEGDAAVS